MSKSRASKLNGYRSMVSRQRNDVYKFKMKKNRKSQYNLVCSTCRKESEPARIKVPGSYEENETGIKISGGKIQDSKLDSK